MLTGHDQLIAALRLILAESEDPQAVVDHALRDVEREQSVLQGRQGDAAPGPYAPNAWSMYVPQAH